MSLLFVSLFLGGGFGLSLCVLQHVFIVKLCACLCNAHEDCLAGRFKELTLLELKLTLNLLALNIRNEEGRDQILNEDLWLVALLFDSVQEVVDRLDLELGFFKGLHRRGRVDCLKNDVLKIAIYRALVHTHQFLVEDIFTFAENLLSLTATRLLSLSLPPFTLSKLYHRCNTTLLLQAH